MGQHQGQCPTHTGRVLNNGTLCLFLAPSQARFMHVILITSPFSPFFFLVVIKTQNLLFSRSVLQVKPLGV